MSPERELTISFKVRFTYKTGQGKSPKVGHTSYSSLNYKIGCPRVHGAMDSVGLWC